MKSFVIILKGNDYSEKVGNRCINSANNFDIPVETFYGVDKDNAIEVMESKGLKWTWAGNNDKSRVCDITGLKQFPYTTDDIRKKIGCSMSHYLLWEKCVKDNEELLILEHDSVFIRKFNLGSIEFNGICQVNNPLRATRKGSWWSQKMIQRKKVGVFEKTWVTNENERDIPDGLAGNSAYMIQPWAAQELINKIKEVGLWPNDALMCKQLFPYLQEYYPFITEVRQERSTTV